MPAENVETPADRARAERLAQGLPPVVEDQVALLRTRRILDRAAESAVAPERAS